MNMWFFFIFMHIRKLPKIRKIAVLGDIWGTGQNNSAHIGTHISIMRAHSAHITRTKKRPAAEVGTATADHWYAEFVITMNFEDPNRKKTKSNKFRFITAPGQPIRSCLFCQ
jgi:hypothetical protein